MNVFAKFALALPLAAALTIGFSAAVLAEGGSDDGNETLHQALGTKLTDVVAVGRDRSWNYTFASWDDGCGAGELPTVTITQQPSHGKLTTEKGIHTVLNKLSICVGKEITGTTLSYTPTKGYSGKDTISYTVDRQETVGGLTGTNSYTVPLTVN